MIRKGLSWLFILVAIAMLAYLIFNDQDTSHTKLQATDGLLDLSEITKEEEIVALSGEWRFIGNKFLEPANFPDRSD